MDRLSSNLDLNLRSKNRLPYLGIEPRAFAYRAVRVQRTTTVLVRQTKRMSTKAHYQLANKRVPNSRAQAWEIFLANT